MAASITRQNAAENRITVCCFWGLLFFPGSKPRDINSAFWYLVTYQQVRPWREGCQINHSRTLWSLKGTYYAYLLCFSTKDGKRASLETLHVVTYRPHWWIDAPEYHRPALVYISVFSCHLYCFSPSSARSFTSLCISPHRTLYCISARPTTADLIYIIFSFCLQTMKWVWNMKTQTTTWLVTCRQLWASF